jgi:hypothetical protein
MGLSRLRLALALATLLVSTPLHAQTGSLAGRVSGPLGDLEGLRVEVSGPTLTTNIVTTTDNRGFYRVANLAPGRYRVTFLSPGFEPHILDDLVVMNGFTRNASMKMGAAPRTLRERLDALTGPDTVDCGNFRYDAREAELLEALRCAREAVARGRAFRIIKDQPMPVDDITMSHGLVGISGGAIVSYRHDLTECRRMGCEDFFTTKACAAPRVQDAPVRPVSQITRAEQERLDAEGLDRPSLSLGVHFECEGVTSPGR